VNTQRATIHIDSIAAGGAGVGRLPDGRAAFVQRTAPGDEATIEIVQEKKRWVRARLLRIVTPGPGRREAPCRHYTHCGGCTLEHLHYEKQLEAKAQIVRETIRRIGGVSIDTPPLTPSPNEFHYRNRLSFTFLRTATGRVIAGFHDVDRPDRVVDISANCLLPEAPLARAWGHLRASWGTGAAYLPSGERLRLTLRVTAQADIGLVIDGGYSAGQPARLLESVPQLRSIWQRPRGADEYRLLGGESAFAESWLDEDVAVSGAVFLQVNRAAAELLEEHVLERARSGHSDSVIDAYCGVGLHARRLARLGHQVVGIELDPAAVQEARRGAPENARFVAGRVEEVIGNVLPADLVIVNPPRAGLEPPATHALLAKPPARILYVSCDPATLARDLSQLTGTFRITDVHCFDLFPQTTHVETVVEMTCATS
jgi:23S rRNA (uracil1939-C5)-methyltransferase